MKRRALVGATALIGAGALALSGCSGDDGGTAASGTPTIVTSTDVWGAVATAVAGDKAKVTALFSNAQGDPHEFEPPASDTAEVADADIILMNGGHYDEYLDDASASSDATVVNAFKLHSGDSGDDHNDDEDHDHDHSGTANEHVFYDLDLVSDVADKLADALAEKDPDDAATYRANADRFDKQIETLSDALDDIKEAHGGAKVAQTEPLAGYLLTEAGLSDVAPAGFTKSVEAGQSPSAADRAALEDLLRSRQVKAFVVNAQAIDPVTEALMKTARSAKVPVVELTETLPKGVISYIDWQRAQIRSLTDALGTAQ
ncbi:ABC transporter substrate-binding protein [Gordonia amarae]|uniref:ABC transporter substrate-binding protein n=2 Tax=Gordonia amarae TaxID=36821 RepID=A0A857KGI1_9ACTN|nr:zinc ABC transporter substrate-binding protein [Gordonia amarae]MCS3877479.1 zinc/manganese transport system substrate-binding protein [Gordonia amarae]QHN16215.1 ABC transporter substrate-binding protein [Gordonia amarae]QHN20784.1 ABC transporter substrate-binding protein [Gordonia amarae]QHN29635.1 ABC transporter substrate-binding protein [Gordonia amarae]QHN38411.1 ABC transporter substrate-binding protein [Gordonia amarae]